MLTVAAVSGAASITAIWITAMCLRYRASQKNADRNVAKAKATAEAAKS